MPRFTLEGRQGVVTGLAVAILLGLMLGSGAFGIPDLGTFIPHGSSSSSSSTPAPAPAEEA